MSLSHRVRNSKYNPVRWVLGKNEPSDKLEFLGTEYKNTGNLDAFGELRAYEKWYQYKDKDGKIIETKEKLHGGKRKTRRNRKSRKSRKNLRISNRR